MLLRFVCLSISKHFLNFIREPDAADAEIIVIYLFTFEDRYHIIGKMTNKPVKTKGAFESKAHNISCLEITSKIW